MYIYTEIILIVSKYFVKLIHNLFNLIPHFGGEVLLGGFFERGIYLELKTFKSFREVFSIGKRSLEERHFLQNLGHTIQK